MNDMNCENILIQKIALLDGEKSEFSAEEIAAHLVGCENCRAQSEEFEKTTILLSRQTRRALNADLWSAIEKKIGAESGAILTVKWQPFVLLGVFLVLYKFVEMVPERDFGWILRPLPFILIAIVFFLIKENPFKINTELILEK